MIFGGTEHERLQCNEATLFSGKPHDYAHEGAVKFLPQIRQLLFEGKQKEAQDLAMKLKPEGSSGTVSISGNKADAACTMK